MAPPRKHQSLEKRTADQLENSREETKSTPGVLQVPENPLINAQIIQILVEKGGSAEVEKLMRLDLDYNKQRLEIVREHSSQHPDAIESRRAKSFRRTQYHALILALFFLLIAMLFVGFPLVLTFAWICVLIVAALSLNGREREVDLTGFVKLLSTIVRREQ
jgi:hypothetical protein